MDVAEALAQDETPKLLKISRTDLVGSQSGVVKKNEPTSSMMLLQLPDQWTPKDLEGAYFVADSSQQVVLTTKQKSFHVHKVETSNALVMIPPTDTSNKRPKLSDADNNSSLRPVATQLLKPGGSGASFLELREKHLDLQVLSETLSTVDFLANNATADFVGHTVQWLSTHLQASEYEMEKGLRSIGAYSLAETLPKQYVLLDEPVLLACHKAILAGLAELDQCQDYAGAGIPVDTFVRSVDAFLNDHEQFGQVQDVLAHCLQSLKSKRQPASGRLRLEVEKIAQCVARQLFLKQTTWDHDSFISGWQSDLPGVGELYQVHTDMLLGLAVCSDNQWALLDVNKLPINTPGKCFDRIFSVKERYTKRELEPYLDKLTLGSSGATKSGLLMQFTKTEEEQRDGVAITYYAKK